MNVLPNPPNDDVFTYNRVVKGLLRSKCFALIFCVSGTVVILTLPLDFLDTKILAIALPSFLTGYIFINLAGIWTAVHGRVDLIADIYFSTIGIMVNILCGIYMLYYWIDWMIRSFNRGNTSDGASFLILSCTCSFNAVAMAAQFAYTMIESNRRSSYGNTTY